MKNLKIAVKLIVSFLLVVVLAIFIGGVGIVGMSQINAADDEMYTSNLLAIAAIGDVAVNYQAQRVEIRNFIMYNAEDDGFKNAVTKMQTLENEMLGHIAAYEKTIDRTDDSTEDEETFASFKENYSVEFHNITVTVKDLGGQNKNAEAMTILNEYATTRAVALAADLAKCAQLNNEGAKAAVDGNTALFVRMTIILVVVLVVAVIFSLVLAFYISSLISKPLARVNTLMTQVGTTGNLDVPHDLSAAMDIDSKNRDEVGNIITAFRGLLAHISRAAASLQTVADGDLTSDIVTLSDKDTLGVSLVKMQNNLNDMFSEINSATSQVATGSKQIADGSQSLAQGSTEQAAAVEQLSSSISEIAQKTKDNAVLAKKAASLSDAVKGNAQKGADQMDQMMTAVKEINDASQSINKVIKVIDDIAFQTNILALNAAVEAARAGQHGKGFAVVAEEVRSLAAKSAAAAKDTGGLIANSMEKAQLGAKIAEETSLSLNEIVKGINESTMIVTDIARSSEEQSLGIVQINSGIDQVAQVVQQNSATAEESAAASEEMSSQSNMLEGLISQFKIKGANSSPRLSSSGASKKRIAMPAKSSYSPNADGDFGKY